MHQTCRYRGGTHERIIWWSDDQGEGRERKGRCWSRCSLVPPSLWLVSITWASSDLSQAINDPLETGRNLCAIWEITQRHLAFARMLWTPWKFIGFPCDSQDEHTARKEGSCSNLGWRQVGPIIWPFWQSSKIKSNLYLSEVRIAKSIVKQGISQSPASSLPPELCSPLSLQHNANTYSKPLVLGYFSLLWTVLEEINWTSLQWEQKEEMNLLFWWYPWHRYWVASLNILQPRVSLLNPLQ